MTDISKALLGVLIFVTVLLCIALSSTDDTAPLRRASAPVVASSCPAADSGKGAMGVCAPKAVGLSAAPTAAPSGITYPDLSNNDPVSPSQMARIAKAHPAVYVKISEGENFTDSYAKGMIASAKANGMAVGGYLFMSTYTDAEVNKFIALLRSYGMKKGAKGWMPATLDIEYGSATRARVQRAVDLVRKAFGRVNIYTGDWYWSRLGCWWPKAVSAWLAGYPTAAKPCGMPSSAYTQHQYTDTGFNGAIPSDMNAWLSSRSEFAKFTGRAPKKPSQRSRDKAHLARLLKERPGLVSRLSAVDAEIAILRKRLGQ